MQEEELELENELHSLAAMPVVKSIAIDYHNKGMQRVICTIWCKARHGKGADKHS